MNTLLLAALLLGPSPSQDEPLPFPVFERDPWKGFGAGSSVTRLTVVSKVRTEETITLKAVDKDSKILVTEKAGQDEQEDTVTFVPFSETLLSADGGYKVSGRSNRQVQIGDRRVKAQVRELTPVDLGFSIWRITTADEMPGGIAELTWKSENEGIRSDVTYAMKGMDQIKAGGQTFDCAKIELTVIEAQKKKRKVEGTYWISEKMPGFLVRARIRDTQDKVTTESSIEVVKFEAKKP